jgi:hypothetical protein
MIVTKPQKPIKPIQPIKPIEPIKPKAPKKTVHHRKFGSEISPPKPKPIPEFGTGGYVQAMREQDHPSGRSTNTPSASSISDTPTWMSYHPSTSSISLSSHNIFNLWSSNQIGP